jgi:hypothetical protein
VAARGEPKPLLERHSRLRDASGKVPAKPQPELDLRGLRGLSVETQRLGSAGRLDHVLDAAEAEEGS